MHSSAPFSGSGRDLRVTPEVQYRAPSLKTPASSVGADVIVTVITTWIRFMPF